MNEQLIVKNFGPIKDATVDFKRVTVFIGPTGGGKSTLAKLAAVFTTASELPQKDELKKTFEDYNLMSFVNPESLLKCKNSGYDFIIRDFEFEFDDNLGDIIKNSGSHFIDDILKAIIIRDDIEFDKKNIEIKKQLVERVYTDVVMSTTRVAAKEVLGDKKPEYITAERVFIPAVEYSWAGLMRDDIGLPKTLLNFANDFSIARKYVSELDIPFLSVKYLHINGRDLIKIPDREEPLMLLETASGIQSVTPLLVLLEHLSRNTEQAQSFIIEEPELNLYPTAQQGLLNWLVEKCTQGENDLTITTHSPYILSHLNLLLYAHQVAEKHPERAEDVANLVPRASWINPKEFACYQVENGGVESLVDAELGLIDTNELDALSGDAADAFDNLIRLSKGFAIK